MIYLMQFIFPSESLHLINLKASKALAPMPIFSGFSQKRLQPYIVGPVLYEALRNAKFNRKNEQRRSAG
jgi:hypothetical protein